MKQFIFIITILFSLFSCNGQTVPGVGGMQKPLTTIGSDGHYDLTDGYWIWISSYHVGGISLTPGAFDFSPDGTTLFIVDLSHHAIDQWSLSTAWDIGTLSFVQTFVTTSQLGYPGEIDVSPDGHTLIVCSWLNSGTGNGKFIQYDLPNAWSLTGITFNQDYDFSSYTPGFYGMFLDDDGSTLIGYSANTTFTGYMKFDLSSSWNVSSSSFVSSVSASQTYVAFAPSSDGNYIYSAIYSSTVRQNPIVTAYNWLTVDESSQLTYNFYPYPPNGIQDIWVHPDGDVLFLISNNDDKIHKWIWVEP